jgi:hypothetical protein
LGKSLGSLGFGGAGEEEGDPGEDEGEEEDAARLLFLLLVTTTPATTATTMTAAMATKLTIYKTNDLSYLWREREKRKTHNPFPAG